VDAPNSHETGVIIAAMPFNLSEKVRVIMHLPSGYTKVLVEWTLGVGMADGGHLLGYSNGSYSSAPSLNGLSVSLTRHGVGGQARG